MAGLRRAEGTERENLQQRRHPYEGEHRPAFETGSAHFRTGAAPVAPPPSRPYAFPDERRTAPAPPAPRRAPTPPPALLPAPRRRARRRLSLGNALRIAVDSLARNKTRSLLAMLGIIIGVGSVIAMLGLGQGTKKVVEEEVRKRGTNNLWVRPREIRQGGIGLGVDNGRKLTFADLALIRKKCPAVIRVAPRVQKNAQIKAGDQNTNTTVYGTTGDFFAIRNMPLDHGRTFRPQEITGRARVCLIGQEVADRLFPRRDPVGKSLRIRGQAFEVIGLTRRRGGAGDGSWDEMVFVPVSTAMKRLFNLKYLQRIEVEAASQGQMDDAQNQIAELLRKTHRLREEQDDDFEIAGQNDLLESSAATNGALQALLAGIASVSLLVGGIGIMNILLVSVAERTREIGIRRAVGAYRRDILVQFLIESLVLCGLGALLGIGAGFAACWAGAASAAWPIDITPDSLILSAGCAVAIGLVFGIYPAVRAANLSPMAALRTEQ